MNRPSVVTERAVPCARLPTSAEAMARPATASRSQDRPYNAGTETRTTAIVSGRLVASGSVQRVNVTASTLFALLTRERPLHRTRLATVRPTAGRSASARVEFRKPMSL